MPQKTTLAPNGFSLLELIIVLGLAALVATAGYTFYASQYRTRIHQERVTQMQQNLRSVMEIMARDIRMAGYDPTGAAGASITAATATQLAFTIAIDGDTNGIDDDGDGAVDEADESTLTTAIAYTITDGDADKRTDIVRSLNGGANVIVGEHIEGLEFNYRLKDETTSGNPSNRDEIIAVRVALLARASRSDAEFNNGTTYTGYETTWGPFNDGFRRRLLLRTIQCRNREFNNVE